MWVKTKYNDLINLTRCEAIVIVRDIGGEWIVVAKHGENEYVLECFEDKGEATKFFEKLGSWLLAKKIG